ncbi:MAG: DRTGG domain-containing protein [Planctomycetota bacterium]|nr:DRTGG domain-containing protein [Planctomycetota bacterium]
MTLEDVKRILEAEVIVGGELLDRHVRTACGSDLMSDVLAFVKPECMLLTGLTNLQVVRTAEMADLGSICFVRGKIPGKQTIKLAEAKDFPLLTTSLSMFESCGRLYREGVTSCFERRQ